MEARQGSDDGGYSPSPSTSCRSVSSTSTSSLKPRCDWLSRASRSSRSCRIRSLGGRLPEPRRKAVDEGRLEDDDQFTLGFRPRRDAEEVAQEGEVLEERDAAALEGLLGAVEPADHGLLSIQHHEVGVSRVLVDGDARCRRPAVAPLDLDHEVNELDGVALLVFPLNHGRDGLHDDARRDELVDRVAGEVAHGKGNVGSALDAPRLAAPHLDARRRDGPADAVRLQESEDRVQLGEVDPVGPDDDLGDGVEERARAEEQAEAVLLLPGRSALLRPEDAAPVAADLADTAQVDLEDQPVDSDLAVRRCGEIRGAAAEDAAHGRVRQTHLEVAGAFTDDEPLVVQDEPERVHERQPRRRKADGRRPAGRVHEGFAVAPLEQRVDVLNEVAKRGIRRDGYELVIVKRAIVLEGRREILRGDRGRGESERQQEENNGEESLWHIVGRGSRSRIRYTSGSQSSDGDLSPYSLHRRPMCRTQPAGGRQGSAVPAFEAPRRFGEPRAGSTRFSAPTAVR